MIPLNLFDLDLDDTDLQENATEMHQDWVTWSLPFSPTLAPEYLYNQLGDYLEEIS